MGGKVVSSGKVTMQEVIAECRGKEDGRGGISNESLNVDVALEEELCCGLFGGKDGDGIVTECRGVENRARW